MKHMTMTNKSNNKPGNSLWVMFDKHDVSGYLFLAINRQNNIVIGSSVLKTVENNW